MIIDLNEKNLEEIHNPALKSYAEKYIQIYQDFLAQVSQFGVELAEEDHHQQVAEKIEALREKGARVRNDSKSLYINRISPACKACQTGEDSATFFISLRCPRSCFYCFNPNQEDYSYYLQNQRNLPAELEEMQAQGGKLRYVALTGGEPLLFKPESIKFFETAQEIFPGIYNRLYTSGDQIDEDILRDLREAHLDEIRISIRLNDPAKERQSTLERIALAQEYIPNVMVEMPVLPDTLAEMKDILTRLDQIGIFGINLLEFCFPYNRANVFRMKNYRIKHRPFRVLYNYWYAGGLPVDGSELECLDLLDFAIDAKLKLGVHYCSLENKHTGQIFQQNSPVQLDPLFWFSQKDYFIKSAKVFGDDIPIVLEHFRKKGFQGYQLNAEYGYLEFPVDQISGLRKLNIQAGLAYYVSEIREGQSILRELKIDLIDPARFRFADI